MAMEYAEIELGDDGQWTAQGADGYLLTENETQRWWPTMYDALDELSREGWAPVLVLDRTRAKDDRYYATSFLLARERPARGGISAL